MTIISTLQMSLRTMRDNKVRTILTVLGIVIGISAVIIVFSASEGIKGLILGQIESFGTNIVESEIKVPTTKKGVAAETQSATAIVQGVQITTMTLDDMKDINKLPNIEKSYAAITGQEQISYGNEMKKAFLYGVSASFIDIDKIGVEEGRFYTEAEEKSLMQVAVLGPKIAKELFGDSDPVGKSIKVRKSKYKVIGILEERGAVFGFDFDENIYIPVMTMQKKLLGVNHVLAIFHKIIDMDIVDETVEEIEYILRENHDIAQPLDPSEKGPDDFRVTNMAEALEILGTVTNAITILLLAIVAISLVVGGVGIMNIMYVIVNERTKEIGLRKAVGAKYSEILKQFLIESVLITIIGGVVGITIGVVISFLISFGAKQAGLDWKFSVPIISFVVALGFSGIFGIVFGVYPARKAAKMDPIEALRNE